MANGIAPRDLDYALGLDANNDGAIIWGELHSRQTAQAGGEDQAFLATALFFALDPQHKDCSR